MLSCLLLKQLAYHNVMKDVLDGAGRERHEQLTEQVNFLYIVRKQSCFCAFFTIAVVFVGCACDVVCDVGTQKFKT